MNLQIGDEVVVFSAHAEMNRPIQRRNSMAKGVLRTRGDEPHRFDAWYLEVKCSPHTRR